MAQEELGPHFGKDAQTFAKCEKGNIGISHYRGYCNPASLPRRSQAPGKVHPNGPKVGGLRSEASDHWTSGMVHGRVSRSHQHSRIRSRYDASDCGVLSPLTQCPVASSTSFALKLRCRRRAAVSGLRLIQAHRPHLSALTAFYGSVRWITMEPVYPLPIQRYKEVAIWSQRFGA
jgi:hypothetical protein